MKLREIESNVDLEEEGRWVTMTGGWEAKVRSTRCNAYRKLQQRHLMANRRFYARRGAPPPEVVDKQAIELVVEALLVDWRGIEDDDGNEIKCTRENAINILSQKRYQVMLDDIADAAQEAETFRTEALEEDAGN